MRTQQFLNLYKTLEEELAAKYESGNRKFGSAVYEFMNSKEGQDYRDELDLCREIRNILSHRADMDGEPVIEPAQALIDVLTEVIQYVRRPPLAMDYATEAETLLKTDLKRNVYELMEIMDRRGFSHVPVMENGIMTGVFSVSTIFSFQLANPQKTLDPQAVVGDLKEFLPIRCHCSENFRFMDREATYLDAREAFDKTVKGKRMAAIFITRTGTQEGKLLGMVTPWDILGKK